MTALSPTDSDRAGEVGGTKVAIIALSKRGADQASRLHQGMAGSVLLLPQKFAGINPDAAQFDKPVAELISDLWDVAGGFCLFMAAGIAVRAVAPLIKSKKIDPAVVVFDPHGKYAVPILGGHLGGANRLAGEAAAILGGQAVITTATDAEGKPAIELWARDAGVVFEDPKTPLIVNAAFADGNPVGLHLDGGSTPPVNMEELAPHLLLLSNDSKAFENFGGVRLALTHGRSPVPGALILRPRDLVLGVGSKKGADPSAVREGVLKALLEAGYSPLSIAGVATVDLKAGEPAILELALFFGVPLKIFSAATLSAQNVPSPSERVRQAVGTPAVAEASALAASRGGRLLLGKIKGKDWTMALSAIGGAA